MHSLAPALPAPRQAAAAGSLRTLWLILAAGAVLRLALWLWYAPLPIGQDDEKDYNALAISLVTRGEFGYSPGRLSSLRPPLYPALVAATYAVCGTENYQAVRLVQMLLGLLTVGVVYLLGRAAATPRVALWAAGLVCFYPSLLGSNYLLLTETLFTLLLTSACLAVAWYYRRGSVWCALAAGVLLALAALTRSVVWLAPPFVAVFLLITGTRGPFGGALPPDAASIPFGRRLLAALLLLAGFAAALAPWSVRNSRLQGSFVAVDVMSGRNFMMGNYAHTPLYRAWDAVAMEGDKAWIHEVGTVYDLSQVDSQAEVDRLAMKRGVAFVRANPALTMKRDVIKFFDFWGLERELVSRAARGWLGDLPPGSTAVLAVLIFGSYALLLFAGVFGALLAPPDDRRVHWFLLAVVAFITGAHTLVFGHSRYHLPLMPIVLLYAALALAQWRAVWARRRSVAFAAAVGVCAILVVGWGWTAAAGEWGKAVGALRSPAA